MARLGGRVGDLGTLSLRRVSDAGGHPWGRTPNVWAQRLTPGSVGMEPGTRGSWRAGGVGSVRCVAEESVFLLAPHCLADRSPALWEQTDPRSSPVLSVPRLSFVTLACELTYSEASSLHLLEQAHPSGEGGENSAGFVLRSWLPPPRPPGTLPALGRRAFLTRTLFPLSRQRPAFLEGSSPANMFPQCLCV